jgi:hypothetical protein
MRFFSFSLGVVWKQGTYRLFGRRSGGRRGLFLGAATVFLAAVALLAFGFLGSAAALAFFSAVFLKSADSL